MYRGIALVVYLFCIVGPSVSELDRGLIWWEASAVAGYHPAGKTVPRSDLVFRYDAVKKPTMDNPLVTVVHKTLKVTARSCVAQLNATENDLEFLRGDPPFPEKTACIVTCLLEKIGIVENNNYSKIGFMTIVSPLVFRNKKRLDHMMTVSENCDKEVKRGESTCQLGNEITICIFKYAPELHFKS